MPPRNSRASECCRTESDGTVRRPLQKVLQEVHVYLHSQVIIFFYLCQAYYITGDSIGPTVHTKNLYISLFLPTVLNRTYGTHKKPGIIFAIFTDNIWSYLLWSPEIVEKYL